MKLPFITRKKHQRILDEEIHAQWERCRWILIARGQRWAQSTKLSGELAYETALRDAAKALEELVSDMSNWSSDETRAVFDVCPDLKLNEWIWAQRGVDRAAMVVKALGGSK